MSNSTGISIWFQYTLSEGLCARQCAGKLTAVALGGAIELDWNEVRCLAACKEYRILPECKALVREVANEFKIKSPLDSH